MRSFSLRDSEGTVIWSIEAAEAAEIRRLDYGAAPAGFRQTVPAGGGPPRRLVPGEILTGVTVTPLRIFTHRGFALGAAAWTITDYEMELITRPIPE